MVSLKKYTRRDLVNSLIQLASKTALILDEDDISLIVSRAVGVLDEVLFNPRVVLFDNNQVKMREGFPFVDATNLKIDAINNVYFSPNDSDNFLTGAAFGVGFFPWLSSMTGLSFMSDVSGYLITQGNLNSLNRRLGTVDDYELWPVDADGKQWLQIRSRPTLFVLEYLPWLDSDADEWILYSPEYQFLLEWCRCQMFLRNAESQLSASGLGFKDTQGQLDYWSKKSDDCLNVFKESSIITFIA